MKAGIEPYKCRRCGGTEYKVWGQKERRRYCLACKARSAKESVRRNGRQVRVTEKDRVYRRKWALMDRYGITLDDYDRMLAEQGGACAICGGGPEGGPATKNYSVDHCHETGLVRGLLCSSCNIGLAKFRDRPELLIAASDYLLAALKAVGVDVEAETDVE